MLMVQFNIARKEDGYFHADMVGSEDITGFGTSEVEALESCIASLSHFVTNENDKLELLKEYVPEMKFDRTIN